MTSTACEIQCGPQCEWIFARTQVSVLRIGGTRVDWTVHPQFRDPLPYVFQLQCNSVGLDAADGWGNVGSPVVNGYYAIDDTQRDFGRWSFTHYRVLLTTPNGTYASKPEPALGNLSKQDWLRAREITRRELLSLRKESGANGYLLKRKITGTDCPVCVDEMTGEIRNAQCPTCYGTGKVGGYYEPLPCFYVRMAQTRHRIHRDANRGTVDDMPVITGRCLAEPQIVSYDVWVEKDTDFRWIIHTIVPAIEIRGKPIVLDPVEMRLAPFSNPVYTVPITGQVPS